MSQMYSVGQLRGIIGQQVSISRWFRVTQAMIDAHADIVEDRQFIHIDPVRAAETPFGTTIAHGFLTLGMLSAMAYDAQPQVEGADLGVNFGINHLRFLAPVPAGACIRAHFTLNDIEVRKPGEITLIWGMSVEIEGQDKPSLVAEWIDRRYRSAPETHLQRGGEGPPVGPDSPPCQGMIR